jgi:tetraacyldisaccharide 4'-kinase
MTWLRVILFPFSLIYGLIVRIRNKLFDWHILPSREFPIPVISIGNLSTGGTGKTPHVEYLIRMLYKEKRIAVLSRGYKRKSKGFVLAGEESSVHDIGDEALQIKSKFPDVLVAVHEKRSAGIKHILDAHPETELIILDDAFQHRYVKPGLNILLTEYYNPFFRNFLLPCGNLREPKSGINRADVVVVTKTPPVFSPLDRRFFLQKLTPYKTNNVFFSSLTYSSLIPLNDFSSKTRTLQFKTIFLITGIANPEALEEHLKKQCQELFVYKYPDHYQFRIDDLKSILNDYHANISRSKAIITTEKDATRLHRPDLKKILSMTVAYYLPVQVRFHEPDKNDFESIIYSFLKGFERTRL